MTSPEQHTLSGLFEIFVSDGGATELVYLNGPAKKIFNIQGDPADFIREASQVVGEERRRGFISSFEDAITLGKDWIFRSQIATQEDLYLTLNAVRMPAESGVHYGGVVAIASSPFSACDPADRYHLLFSHMQSGLSMQEIILDETGTPIDYRFIEVNPAFERLIGVKAGDVLGRTVLDVFPGTEQYWIEKFGQVALDGKPISYQNYSREIGCWFETQVFRPAPHQFAVTFNDITELKNSFASLEEANLRLSELAERVRNRERRLQALFDTEIDGILLIGAGGEITDINEAGLKLFGKERLEGESLHIDSIIREEDRHLFADQVARALEGATSALESQLTLPSGEARLFELRIAPVRSDKTGPSSILVVTRDITDHRLLEQERANRAEILEELVILRTEDLRLATLKAEEATRSKSAFLANMSHEIRTPLNAILGMTDLVLRSELQPRQRQFLSNSKSAAVSLLKIIDDILDFSKVEAGKIELEEKAFPLEKLLDSVAAVTAHRALDKKLELLFDLASDLPLTIIGDSVRVGQILINLIGNAIKFTQQGVVQVAIRRGPARDKDRMRLLFSVRDTGIGMNADQVERLFKPFSQGDASTTRLYGGTGLGLVITERLIALMGGSISVTSEMGVGTTLSFELAVKYDETHQAAEARPTPDLRGLRALVIDDNQAARDIFCDVLTRFGMGATAVASGKEGLSAFRAAVGQNPYDIVFIDWRLQDEDGIDVAKSFRADPGCGPQTRIIMVTAYGTDELQRESGQVALDALISKPITPSALMDALCTAFHGGESGGPAIGQNELSGEWKETIAGKRILIVEDNAVNQMLAEELLSVIAGASIKIANDGVEALEMLEGQAFDLILMDIHMPRLDGLAATRKIRADRRFLTMPIIALTAGAIQEERQQCLGAGMDDIVTKPFEPEILFATVARWLRRRAT